MYVREIVKEILKSKIKEKNKFVLSKLLDGELEI